MPPGKLNGLNELDLSNFEHSFPEHRVLGWGFLAFGAVMLLATIVGILNGNAGFHTPSEQTKAIFIACLIILPLFGVLGAYLLSFRKRVWVDFQEGVVGTESQDLLFRRRKELPLSSDGRVVHREKVVSGGEYDKTVWVVEYTCADGSLELHRQADSTQGRAWAERMAEHLALTLVESVDGTYSVRSVEDLDRSVMDQGLSEGLEWPSQKVSGRVHWSPGAGGAVEVAIRPPGFGLDTAVALAFVAVIFVIVLLSIDVSPEERHFGVYLAWVVYALLLGGLSLSAVNTIRNAMVVVQRWTIDRDGVGLSHDDTTMIPAAEIEQVEVGEDGCLSVRSDAGSHAMGSGLKKSELKALRSVVLLGLSGLAPGRTALRSEPREARPLDSKVRDH